MPFDFSALVTVLSLLAVIAALVAYVIRVCTAETRATDRARLIVAKTAHDASLAELALEPENSELRQRALSMGRVYSSLTGDDEGSIRYDEAALKSDLEAVCNRIANQPSQSVGRSSSRLSQLG